MLIALMFTAVSAARCEDLMGYVLRRAFWGVDYYWVHDSNHWGEPTSDIR